MKVTETQEEQWKECVEESGREYEDASTTSHAENTHVHAGVGG